MDTVKATLGDATLDASGGIGWSVIAGVEPFTQTFVLDADEAAKIVPREGRRSEPLTLRIEASNGKTMEVRNLYVIGETETIDPYRRTILVADLRIWWRRRRFRGSYNVRRRTGERRRLTEDGVPQQVQQVADDVFYHPATLKDGKPWQPREVVERILEGLAPGAWVGSLGAFGSPPLEDLDIDDEGGTALRRAMNYLTGADVYVGIDGRVHVYDTTAVDATAQLVDRLRRENPSFVNGQWPSFSDRSALRPEKVRVLFQVEQEIRLDSVLSGETITQDQRYLQNVAPIPDPTLVVGGVTKVSGTYEVLDDARMFAAWNADKGNAAIPDISDATLREFWVSGFPEAYWASLGELAPSANWVERIACCRAHYSQTFRINRRWVDRVYQFRPYRVSIIDQENGLFARAQAYTGYCIVASTKGLLSDPAKQYWMLNVDGSLAIGESLSNGSVAPCLVEIVDPETGIIRLDYQTDLLGHYRQIIPRMVENVPTADPSKAGALVPLMADGSVYDGDVGVTLKADNRVTIVLTAVPAAPNGKGQFKAIEVKAEDAIAMLPGGARAYAQKSSGPVWEVRVGGQLATARYAWSDALSAQIERSFGVGAPVSQSDDDQRAALDPLLCNKAEMESLAKAMAASVYAGLLDSWVGDHVMDLDPGVVPTGTIRQVSHTISTTGVTATAVMMRGDGVAYDPMAMLPDSARRLFLRTVQP